MTDTVTKSKIQVLQEGADKAYALDTGNARDNYAWFYAQPLENLTALWAIACVQGAAWDDEVYDALAALGWFEDDS